MKAKRGTPADIEIKSCLAKDGGCFSVISGAGSGKTTSLIKALDFVLAEKGAVLAARSQQVACITYTEVAVGEIEEDVQHNPLVHVSTILSFLWSVVAPFQSDIKSWVIKRISEKLVKLEAERNKFGPRTQEATKRTTEKKTAKLLLANESINRVEHFRYESGSDYSDGVIGHDDVLKMVPELIRTKFLLPKIICSRFPICFVDESKDTFVDVVQALQTVAGACGGYFHLGFFGDPMQKIYSTDAGDIGRPPNWKLILKPENFRSSTAVLNVINRIRAGGDGMQQKSGRKLCEKGSANLFLLPADENRQANLQKVRRWLAETLPDPLWLEDSEEADVRVLVTLHRTAAHRLGFPMLFQAFDQDEAIRASFREGSSWQLSPFLKVLMPLVKAYRDGKNSEVLAALREHSAGFNRLNEIVDQKQFVDVLSSVKKAIVRLCELLHDTSESTLEETLLFAHQEKLLILDKRFEPHLVHLETPAEQEDKERIDDDVDDDKKAKLAALFGVLRSCPTKELFCYERYINQLSPYSTQHSVKGAEFQRVLVIIDEEQGELPMLSYSKLLGLEALSDTDLKNKREGRETVVDRTRRLFYVCCSRALKDLAVIVYTSSPLAAKKSLMKQQIFEETAIHALGELG